MNVKKRTNALRERIESRLELPVGVLTAAPRIELYGNRRAIVENCRRVLECTEERLCLRTAVGILRFTGEALCLHCRTAECAVVTGKLLSLEFLQEGTV